MSCSLQLLQVMAGMDSASPAMMHLPLESWHSQAPNIIGRKFMGSGKEQYKQICLGVTIEFISRNMRSIANCKLYQSAVVVNCCLVFFLSCGFCLSLKQVQKFLLKCWQF